jgi:hypothetical protein
VLINSHSTLLSDLANLSVSAGLGKGLDDVMNTDELVNEEDITAALQEAPVKGRGRCRGLQEQQQQQQQRQSTPDKMAAASLLTSSDSLSARERNKLRRTARALQRQESVKAADGKSRVRVTAKSSTGGPMMGRVQHPLGGRDAWGQHWAGQAHTCRRTTGGVGHTLLLLLLCVVYGCDTMCVPPHVCVPQRMCVT